MNDQIIDEYLHSPRQETVVVKQFYTLIAAEIYAAQLRDLGIYCFLANAEAYSSVVVGTSPVRLHVNKMQLEQAIPVIKMLDEQNQEPTRSKSNRILTIVAFVLICLCLILYSVLHLR
jgi:hypothetical protein